MTEHEDRTPAVIRLADGRDAAVISEIYAPEVRDTIISFETVPPSADEMRSRIEHTMEKFPWLVCERDGQVVGYAYASEHRSRSAYQWCVDVSAYVRSQERRTGVGRALYTSLFSVLRLLGYYNAYAGIAFPNPASVGMHESVGFRPVGVYTEVGYKFDGWHDVGWWHLPLQEKSESPKPPVGLWEITDPAVYLDDALASGLDLLGPRP